MMDGIIKSYGQQRYGYITPRGGGPDVWFSGDRVEGIEESDLRPGVPVTYELTHGKKKPQAAWVRPGTAQPGRETRVETSGPRNYLRRYIPSLVYPYSFVRLGRPASRTRPVGHDRYTGLCGRIVCEVVPWSPLCIPDTERVVWELGGQHPKYPFFRVDDQPAIPGSSLKGAIRSLFETITQSAWSVVDSDPISYRLNPRVGTEQHQMLDFQPAQVVTLPAEFGQEGRVLLFDRVERVPLHVARSHQDGEKLTWNGATGYLHRTGDFLGKKRHEMLFVAGSGATPPRQAPLPYEAARLYDKMHEVLGSKNRQFRRLHQGALIYVKLGGDGKVVAIADTRVPRISYPRSISDLLRQHDDSPGRSFLPQADATRLDPASRLFGAISGDSRSVEGIGYRGQLRLSTAWGESDTRFVEWRTLRILGQPHPTSFTFYLQHRQAPVSDPTRLPTIMEPVRLPESLNGQRSIRYDHPQAQLRGRKYYWNHPAAREDPGEYALDADSQWAQTGLPVKSDQNATVELLMPGSSPLTFLVDYEGLTEWELGALLWSLSPSWPGHSLALRLGRGKPLGLGAVQVTIREHEVQDRVARYSSLLTSGARPATLTDHDRWTLAFFEWLLSEQTDHADPPETAASMSRELLDRRLEVARGAFEQISWWQDLLRLLDTDGPPPGADGCRPPIHYPRFYALDQPQNRRSNQIGRRTFEWFRPFKEGDQDPQRAYSPLACEVPDLLLPDEEETPA